MSKIIKKDKPVKIVNEPVIKVIKQKAINKNMAKAIGYPISDDIHIEQTQCWEDLNNIYNDLAKGMIDLSQQVAAIINNIKLSGNVITGELSIAIKALYTDLDNMSKDLSDILKHHEGKTGVVKNDDELSQLLEIFNMYFLLFDRFRALTFQELLVITEHAMAIKNTAEANLSDAEIVSETLIENIEVKNAD
jgi:hypothetical protein